MKLSILLFSLIIPSLVLQPVQASNFWIIEQTSNHYKRPELLSYDQILTLLDDIENDTLSDEYDENELTQFLIYLMRNGVIPGSKEAIQLEKDIQELLEEDGSYSFNFGEGKIFLCGGWIKKKWKKITKVVKEHKNEVLIGTIIVAGGIVIGVGVAAAAGAFSTAATAASAKKEDKKHHKDRRIEETLVDAHKVEPLIENPPYVALQEVPQIEEIIQDEVDHLKEVIIESLHQEKLDNDPSFPENLRIYGAHFIHDAIESMFEFFSFFPAFADEVRGIFNNTDSSRISTYEAFEYKTHEAIDEFFSTDQAGYYSEEIKENHLNNGWSIGTIPPPSKAVSATASTIERLLEAGNILDRGSYTKAGRALMKHGYRDGSVFPKPRGTPEQINMQGQMILERILNDPNKVTHQLPDGSLKIFSSDGRGVFFKKDGSFRGFIEKQHE